MSKFDKFRQVTAIIISLLTILILTMVAIVFIKAAWTVGL